MRRPDRFATRTPLTLLALLPLALSGCLGAGKDPAQASDPTGGGLPPVDPGFTTAFNDDNSAHHHNYWGGATQVDVFRGTLPIEPLPLNGMLYEGCNAIGHAEFNFESDADDVGPEGPAINPSPATGGGPKADVVFPGTSHLLVTVTWGPNDPASQQYVTTLVLAYKPASKPFYEDEAYLEADGSKLDTLPCGLVVPNGEAFRIPVKSLQFDPAHQVALSRWRFQIWAGADGGGVTLPGGYGPPGVALGEASISMVAVYGGSTLLDPPHPDFFGNETVLDLGVRSGEANFTLIVVPPWPGAIPQVADSPLGYEGSNAEEIRDITLPRGSIVPLGMRMLEVTACLHPGGNVPANPETRYRVSYHGADHDGYATLEPFGSAGACDVYRIEDPDGLKADSPYEIVSQWSFRIVPVTGGQPNAGHFEGSFDFHFMAFEDVPPGGS